jgi:hypothetical protein
MKPWHGKQQNKAYFTTEAEAEKISGRKVITILKNRHLLQDIVTRLNSVLHTVVHKMTNGVLSTLLTC